MGHGVEYKKYREIFSYSMLYTISHKDETWNKNFLESPIKLLFMITTAIQIDKQKMSQNDKKYRNRQT